MPRDLEFHEFVMNDLFSNLKGVTSRPMFGGYGIYKKGTIFAIIVDGQLYFKVDDSNQHDYEEYDSEQFVYVAPNGKEMKMSYWRLPEDIMEKKDTISEWVEKAVIVGKNSKKK